MNVDIKSKAENKLLERKEIEAEVSFSGATPSRAELRKAISAKVGANPELVVLREVRSTFGKQSVVVVAHAYEKAEELSSSEPEHIRKRDKIGEEKKEEVPKEEPAEAPKEEPKAEAPKEEKPKEEKPAEAPKEEKKEEKLAEAPKEPPKEEPKEEKQG